jgi:hypothetical protein
MIGGSSLCRVWKFFSSPPRPDRLWGPLSILSNGYQRLFPWGKSGRGVKLTIHLHLVPRLRVRGAIHVLPQYAFMAWCSVKITGTTLPLSYRGLGNQNFRLSVWCDFEVPGMVLLPYVKGTMRVGTSRDICICVSTCINYNINKLSPVVWKLWRW